MTMVFTLFDASNTLPAEMANFGFEASFKTLGRPGGTVTLSEEIWQE